MASFKPVEVGSVYWDERKVSENKYWYRSRNIFFDSCRDLFSRLTVNQNFQVYADFFNIKATGDRQFLGPVDPGKQVCSLDSVEILRVKLAIYQIINRPLLFYANPFGRLNSEERESAFSLFKELSNSDLIVITGGTFSSPPADKIIE